MTITTIAFDGDDTLWHHDNYFREATQEFHNYMNSLGSFPDALAQLDTKHIQDIAQWGYGVMGLTLSMIELSVQMTSGKITGDQIQVIFDIGRKAHQHPVILLDHVAETIGALHDRYQLLLITKGDLIAQEMKVHKSGLAEFFDGIEIVSEKDVPTYEHIFELYRVDPSEVVMIGNTLRSDIIPPLKLGAQAVHIPYHTSWHFEQGEVAEADRNNFIILPSMKDLPQLLEKAAQRDDANLSLALQAA